MKLPYISPILETVELDTEVSLILLSGGGAPGDPESMMLQTDFILDEPLISDVTILGL